ncbi:MAG: DUF2461 domain-containing protein [Alphaproteobacteria bacterium]|nr:DUF2461 domain-containing protein [Alphaproteobacteria bacterium SS10]
MSKNALGFSARSFTLLTELAANNNREWYLPHKVEIGEHLLDPFIAMLGSISFQLQARDMPFQGGKKTMFRMNRDTRFSKDKTPYRTNIAGLLSPSGTRDDAEPFIYLQIDRTGGFVAAGRYNLTAKALAPIRNRIVEHEDRFARMEESLAKAGLALDYSMSLSSMPRGYAEHADHRFAKAIKLTSLITRRDIPKADWKSGKVIDEAVEFGMAVRPLIDFLSGLSRAD